MDFDFTDDVRGLQVPTMFVAADAVSPLIRCPKPAVARAPGMAASAPSDWRRAMRSRT